MPLTWPGVPVPSHGRKSYRRRPWRRTTYRPRPTSRAQHRCASTTSGTKNDKRYLSNALYKTFTTSLEYILSGIAKRYWTMTITNYSAVVPQRARVDIHRVRLRDTAGKWTCRLQFPRRAQQWAGSSARWTSSTFPVPAAGPYITPRSPAAVWRAETRQRLVVSGARVGAVLPEGLPSGPA